MIRAVFLGLANVAAIGILLLAVAYWNSARSKDGCEQRQVFAEAVSPDGAWIARFYQNVCGGGFGTTYVDDTVEIARPSEAPQRVPVAGVVFEMDDHFYDQPKPMTLRWLDKTKLEITIPNNAWAGRQQESFADLAISYRYLHDDPIERACLKQWRSLPTDEMVRRSSSPTENIKAFLARCHAEHLPQ